MKKNISIEKFKKREKKVKIIILILIILIIFEILITKYMLLYENYHYISKSPNSNYIMDMDVKYITDKKLYFNECNECKYIKYYELSIPDRIDNYVLQIEEENLEEFNTKNSITLKYINEKDENEIIYYMIDTVSKEKLKKVSHYNYIKMLNQLDNEKDFEFDYYDTAKYIYSNYNKNLKGSIFDSYKELNEKNTLLYLMLVTVRPDIDIITMCNYENINNIIELKTDILESKINKTDNGNYKNYCEYYIFETNTREYTVDVIGIDPSIDKSYLSYIKINNN